MLVIIVGCGRMGAMMANKLSSSGESVIIIDSEESSFNKLTTEFSGFMVLGDATQVEVLKQAKIEQADLLLALTGDDNVNLTVAQVGKNFFNLKRTIARVYDPEREYIFKALSIETITPIRLAVAHLLEALNMAPAEAKAG